MAVGPGAAHAPAAVPGRDPPRHRVADRWPRAWPPRSIASSDGRLLINVVTGGDPAEAEGDGVFLDPRRALRRHRRVPQHLARRAGGRDGRPRRHATCASRGPRCSTRRCRSRTRRSTSAARRPPRTSWPPSTSTSTSPGASRPPRWRRRSPTCARRAAAPGRTLRFGIRLHVIVRETASRGLGRGRRADQPPRRPAPSPPAQRAFAALRLRRAAAHVGAARRPPRASSR